MADRKTQVLIVGAGPAGLTSALLLARFGVKALVIDRHPGVSIHPRARGINVRTMEVFRGLGLETKLRDAGHDLDEGKLMLFAESLAGKELRRIPQEDLMTVGDELAQVSPCDWLLLSQDKLEPILLQAAHDAGAEVSFSRELHSLRVTENNVQATVRANGLATEIEAEYCIAADGARSFVRGSLGIVAPSIAPPFGPFGKFVNIYFRAELSALVSHRPFGICFIEQDGLDGVLLPVNLRDRWLLNVRLTGEHSDAASFTERVCEEYVFRAIGWRDTRLEILSVLPWEAGARVADRFRYGRVFLAGDAAHVMPPSGAFGLNAAVQDAHALAWRLASVLRDPATESLLDGYEVERKEVAQAIVQHSVREFLGGGEQHDSDERFVPPEQDAQDSPAWGGPESAEQMAQLKREQLSLVLGPPLPRGDFAPEEDAVDAYTLPDGRPGMRVPHAWVEHNGERVSTIDLVGHHWTMFTGAANAQEWSETRVIEEALGSRVMLQELPDDVAARIGLAERGAMLVRPDGMVAWRSAKGEQPSHSSLRTMMEKLRPLSMQRV